MVEILIWIAAIFAAGSVLVLERRCLGQRALVQPLVLCLLVGWYVENVETALWLGVSLQLLSLAPSRTVDWALATVVASSGLWASDRFGISLDVGRPETSALLLVTVVSGMVSRYVERSFAKWDREKIAKHPPWRESNPVRAVERAVYKAIVRWFFVGGVEVLVGLGVAMLAVIGAAHVSTTPVWMARMSAVAIPAVGAAVVLTALTGKQFIVWAGAAAGVTIVFFSTVIS